MRVLVTGVSGQLGHDVMIELQNRRLTGIASGELDITDENAVNKMICDVRPDAVIHCAAWTAVDAAEEADNADKARAVNADGTRYIAQACRAIGAKLLYISTDYVFDGGGEEPWQPDCTDFAPLSVYGRTKLCGERAVAEALDKFFIVRTAWVFGENGNNFVRTMLRLGKTHDALQVVCDQIGTPTYTKDLAVLLVDMIRTEKYGCYHATNEGGYISWYDFAREIFRQAALLGHAEYETDRLSVRAVTTAEYGAARAARPLNSRLDKSRLTQEGFAPLPTWQDALHRFLRKIDFETL